MVGLLSLPTELQLQILTYIVQSLDEAPSEAKFDQEPSIHLVRSSNHPLKDLSLVCSELRQLVLPALFEYACINILDQQGEEIKKTQIQELTASVGLFGEWKRRPEQKFGKSLLTSIQAFIEFTSNCVVKTTVKSLQ